MCTDLINSWTDLSVDERDSLLGEVLFPDDMLCPNTTSILVNEATSGTFFETSIKATQLGLDTKAVDFSVIHKADITRYFNAE